MGLEESPSGRVSRKNAVPGRGEGKGRGAEGAGAGGEVGYPTSVFFLLTLGAGWENDGE